MSQSGSPLDPPTKEFMESRFGYDFSKVRLHTDEQSARSAHSFNALAYTRGKNIVFGSGQYSPRTTKGRKLLAHELAHVIQRGSSEGNTVTSQKQIEPRADGGYRIAVAPNITDEPIELESKANTIADYITRSKR